MDYSFISLILFAVSTLLYFAFLKPKLSVDLLSTPNGFENYYTSTNKTLLMYIGIVVASQLFLNIFYLLSKCGGSSGQNIGAAVGYTFIPYLFIFGVLVAVLVIFPGFKSAFSNVIGYFFISSKANSLLNDLLVNSEVGNATEGLGSDQQEKLERSAELIMKICGNKSLLINQINPENFMSVWQNMLLPLIKKSISENADVLKEKQSELLHLVNTKDNVGEACWYIYAGILVSSIVSYNLATRGCVKSVEQIKQDHDKYISEQEAVAEETKLKAQTVYS